jgi:hypothetical protein
VKGQAAAEFVFVTGAVVMIVAVVALVGLRESELSVGLASARLAASNFSAQNPEFKLSYVNYSVDDGLRRVLVRPKFHYFAIGALGVDSANASVVNGAIWALGHSFHPASAGQFTVGNCVRASYYEYCVAPCFGGLAAECNA